MLDREGFRPNVGIILLNQKNQVFWGKRIRTHSWQFPQGGIKYGETPEQAMFRELHEEVGLTPDHVRIIARRVRRLMPQARILACFWMLGEDPDKLEAWRKAVGADLAAASLRSAAEQVLAAARAGSRAPVHS